MSPSEEAGAVGQPTERRARGPETRAWGALPTRIVLVVFSAALVSGLTVTLVSTRSTEAFLREEIDERFPERLVATARSLENWTVQSELGLAAFARSGIVVRGAVDSGSHAREEALRYLRYVLEDLPRYRAMQVLDTEGEVRVAVGDAIPLASALRARLASNRGAPGGHRLQWNGNSFQVLTSPIERSGERVGTLLGVLPVESLQPLLGGDGLEPGVGIYLVDEAGSVVVASSGAPARVRFERLPSNSDEPRRIESYTRSDGVQVIGTAMPLENRAWVLVIEQDYQLAFAPVLGVVRKVSAINFGIVLLFCGIAGWIARSIVRPIHVLSERARRIAAGEPDVEFAPSSRSDEIGVLSRVFHEMVEKLRSQRREVELANAELQRSNEVLEQLSFTDGLTRLHNHRFFQDRLRIEAQRTQRTGDPLALLLLDIDDFKALNDRHGHAAGDAVLRRVGEVIEETVRETDLPARYGGEEFAVLAPCTGLEGAESLGEKLRAAIRAVSVPSGDGRLQVTVSVGGAVLAGDPQQLFVAADRALYRAKGSGKDCVVIEAPEPEDAA